MVSQDRKICCVNHYLERQFATQFIDTMAMFKGTSQYAVVTFADTADKIIGLSESDEATSAINSLTYTGGFTNTGQAIMKCGHYLDHGSSKNKVIIVLTDGEPTRSIEGNDKNSQHLAYAMDKATAEKNKGTTIIGVTVDTVSTDVAKVKKIATSDNHVLGVDSFEALDVTAVKELVKIVCHPTPTSSPTATPTS